MFPLPTSPLALSTCSPSRPWPPPRRWLGSSRRPRPRPPSQRTRWPRAWPPRTTSPGCAAALDPGLTRHARAESLRRSCSRAGLQPRRTQAAPALPRPRCTPVPRPCRTRAATTIPILSTRAPKPSAATRTRGASTDELLFDHN